jgi:hypothetical protein
MLCRFTNSGECAAKHPSACVCNQGPAFFIFGLADISPEALHNVIADAVGEPRVDPNSRRVLRKADGTSTEGSGRKLDDGPSSKGKR